MFCLKIYFIKTSCHRNQANDLQSKPNQLTGFNMEWVCTERYFRIDYIHSRIMFSSLRTVLNCSVLNNLSRLLLPIATVMNFALSL